MKIKKIIEKIDSFFKKNDKPKEKKLKKLKEIEGKLKSKRKKLKNKLTQKNLSEKEREILRDEFKVVNQLSIKIRKQF